MAVFNSLTFDGENSLDYGVYISGEAVYDAPERAVEMISIPGRNGAIALDQGRFENIDVTYPAGAFGNDQAEFAAKMRKFRNLLASRYSYVRLTDSYHPDEFRLGLYKSGLNASPVQYGSAGQFPITFNCKPQRFLTSGEAEVDASEWSGVQSKSGAIVEIDNSEGEFGIKSLVADIDPIQDFNGYDKPWVGGAGENLLYVNPQSITASGVTVTINDDESITLNGTATANAGVLVNASQLVRNIPTGSYYGKLFGDNLNGLSFQVYHDGTAIMTSPKGTFTIPDDSANNYVRIRFANGSVFSNVTVRMMMVSGTTEPTEWKPYENLCPISGYAEVAVNRTGKNLFDKDAVTQTVYIDSEGVLHTSSTFDVSDYIGVSEGTLYYSGCPSGFGSNPRTCFFDANKNFLSSIRITSLTGGSITVPSGASYMRLSVAKADIDTFQLEIGSSASEYEAFGNSYTTELIPQLIDKSTNQSGAIDANGNEIANSSFNRTSLIPVSEGTIFFKSDVPSGYTIRIHGYRNGTWVQQLAAISTAVGYETSIVIPSTINQVRVSYPTIGINNTYLYDGEPYYGGSLDVVSGVLTVDRAMVDLGSLTWTRNTTDYSYAYFYSGGVSGLKPAPIVCSCYPFVTGGKAALTDGSISYYTGASTRIAIRNDDYTDATAFKTSLSGQTAVYELATPQTYQLTPQEIDLLLGENNIWASTGDVTVEYGTSPLYNSTEFDAKPLIKVVGTGTFRVGDTTVTITGTAGQTIYIDCETMEIYKLVDGAPQSAASLVSFSGNDFPVLKAGNNTVGLGTGITSVTIIPRWWII